MKDLDQQIEDAAKDYGQREGMFLSITKAVAFTAGAKSEAAKEFHQQEMFLKEDMLEAFKTGQNKAIASINEDRFDEEDNAPTFEQWINFYKK